MFGIDEIVTKYGMLKETNINLNRLNAQQEALIEELRIAINDALIVIDDAPEKAEEWLKSALKKTENR